MVDPPSLPSWLTQEDLDYYVKQYEQSGFRGPLNWYRNIDRNADLTPQLAGEKIQQPSLFIAGSKDLVLTFAGGAWVKEMDKWVADLRGKIIVEGAGHWVQAEKPAQVNEVLIPFLKSIA